MKRTPLGLALLLFASLGCSTTSHPVPVAGEHASTAHGAAAFDPQRLTRVTDVARTAVERGDYAGVSYLVMHDGQTVVEGAFGFADAEKHTPLKPDTIVRLYSMSKVITAVAALQLMEDGVIRLDDPIAKWLPELEKLQVLTGGTADAPTLEPLAKPITVKNLLNHTGGFTYDFVPGPVAELYQRADLWNATSLDEFIARVAKLPLYRQPGIAFDYSIGDDVLGALIQRASGMSFEAFVEKRITQPLGLHDTFFDVPAEKMGRVSALHTRDGQGFKTAAIMFGAYAEPGRGFASGGAGLFSTIHDYARFAQCLVNGGTIDGARILGRKTVELALENSLPAGANVYDPSMGWGLFAAVRQPAPPAPSMGELGSAGTFTWSGAATTHFFADPKEHLVALVFAQHTPFDERQMFPRFRTAVYQALR